MIEDQQYFLTRSLKIAHAAGIKDAAIVLDPGFGFAKNRDDDMELIARFRELQSLGFPLLAGTSRKRFVGSVTMRDPADQRDIGTAATTAILRLAGAAIFRVHNVAANRDALLMADAVLASRAAQREES